MADEDKPTQEQIDEADKAEDEKWQGDFKEEDLKIPYKREAEDDKSKNGTTDSSATADKGNGTSSDEDVEDEEIQEVHEEPTPVVTIQDPGEYKPADYSFDVTLADGKTVKISNPEDAEKISEDPDNFKTPKQLLDFIKRSTQMQNKLDKDLERYEEQKNAFNIQTQTQSQRQEIVNNTANEIEYLVEKGKLPKADEKYATANWSDPLVSKQPGVKEQIALLNYMSKENNLRAKAGIKPFGPIDALTAMQSDENEQARLKKAKEAGEQRRAASSKVAGVSPTQTGAYVPKGIAVGNPNVFKRNQAVWDN